MQKTKKKKNHNIKRKQELWASFEKSFQNNEDEKERVECLYSNQKPENRSHCELCKNI